MARLKPRITVLFDTDGPPPKDQDYTVQFKESKEAEFDVARTLKALGHRVDLLGFEKDIQTIIRGLKRLRPKAVFNLAEGFGHDAALDYAVAAVLEMLEIPYTGSPPIALQIARDKALSKKILDFHGIRVPEFAVFRRGEENMLPSDLRFPLIVKPLREDASLGISQSSVVHDAPTLDERVAFIHEKLLDHAIVEELIFGREIYLAILGNDPPEPLTPIEMIFKKEEDEELKIATYRAKWSAKYRKDKGIENVPAKDIKGEILEKVHHAAMTVYRRLHLRDYARIDMRLTPDNQVYVIEANPNPFIAIDEDVPHAAEEAGISYKEFIRTITKLALSRK